MNTQRIITVQGVEYPNGHISACYALESNGVAACVETRRAIALQREGVPYVAGHFMPDQFSTFFGPDFRPIGF